jgi:hypothetical protein
MRGKLRDKRSYSKHDSFKREENEQRRPYKRDSRTATWDNQQVEDDEFYDATEDDPAEDANNEEVAINVNGKK